MKKRRNLVKQLRERGVEKLMHKLSLGYTKYFNNKHNRSGTLFEGTYRAAEIKSEAQLLYLSAYINGNVDIHKIAKAEDWPWSSYPDYLGQRKGNLRHREIILKEFDSSRSYQEYVQGVIMHSRQIKDKIKTYLLE